MLCFQILISFNCFRQKIERSTLTGANREVIVSTALYPFAMTLFDQHIYWTDWNTRSVYRANKYDGSDQIVMISNLPSRPMDIHVWAKSKQQTCTNPCNQFNGGCSHICVTGKKTKILNNELNNICIVTESFNKESDQRREFYLSSCAQITF